MAGRKNKISFEVKGLDELIIKFDEMQKDIKPALTKALTDAGAEVGEDTYKAMAKQYLPAQGKYQRNPPVTINSVIRNPEPKWEGSVITMGVGFDKSKEGVGTLLITGTPRMKPDRELEKIYSKKTYNNKLNEKMKRFLKEWLED